MEPNQPLKVVSSQLRMGGKDGLPKAVEEKVDRRITGALRAPFYVKDVQRFAKSIENDIKSGGYFADVKVTLEMKGPGTVRLITTIKMLELGTL